MEQIIGPNFNDMSIGTLRKYASHMRVALDKSATKEDIIKSLTNKLKNRSTVELAVSESKLRPGYAKIRVLPDPTPGAANYPFQLNCNGYQCYIPIDVEIIVPMRVVRTLNDATVMRMSQSESTDQFGRQAMVTKTVRTPSYAFQLLDHNPGPEPLTALEISKRKTARPRERYRELFARWPRPKDLIRAIEHKLISLNPDDELSTATLDVIDTKDDILEG